jgi:hypothetical protein
VSNAVGNKNVLSTRNRLMLLKKRYNFNIECKTGSGIIETRQNNQIAQNSGDATNKAVRGAKRGRKQQASSSAATVQGSADEGDAASDNEKPAPKKQSTSKNNGKKIASKEKGEEA